MLKLFIKKLFGVLALLAGAASAWMMASGQFYHRPGQLADWLSMTHQVFMMIACFVVGWRWVRFERSR